MICAVQRNWRQKTQIFAVAFCDGGPLFFLNARWRTVYSRFFRKKATGPGPSKLEKRRDMRHRKPIFCDCGVAYVYSQYPSEFVVMSRRSVKSKQVLDVPAGQNVEDISGCNPDASRIEKGNSDSFELIVLDAGMSTEEILEVLQIFRERKSEIDVMIVTGRGDLEEVVEAIRQVAKNVEVTPVVDAYAVSILGKRPERRQAHTHVLAGRLDRYLEQHFHQESLSLNDLCTKFRISSSYVTRLFKEQVGMSFRKRLNLHRVQKAKYLLRTTDLTVDCIANDCGFRNCSRLTEAFYRFEGMPPGRFRRICGS